MGFNTDLLHAGVVREEKGATLPPIYQNTAFEQESAGKLEEIFESRRPGYCYTRVGNPTITAFENRITKIEKGMASIACASGMAAITNALLNILEAGDEIISSASLYGGTVDLFRDLESFGITTHFVKNNDWEAIEKAFNHKTRVVYAETIGNPGLDVTDVRKLSDIAHEHQVPLVIDNTTATSYLIRPIEYGADIVVNSSSKYINGSGNAVSGVLTDSGKFRWTFEKYPGLAEYRRFGPMCYIAKLRNGPLRNMGACLAPMTAYQNMIGLETMGLRMERECRNALELAEWIQKEYPLYKVNYPGLKSSPWFETAQSELKNGSGAILTIRLGSKENAFKFIDGLKLAYKLSNIGDTKTLVIHPASTISVHSSVQEKENAGVYDDLVRVSVGIEDIEDIIEDFKQSFETL